MSLKIGNWELGIGHRIISPISPIPNSQFYPELNARSQCPMPNAQCPIPNVMAMFNLLSWLYRRYRRRSLHYLLLAAIATFAIVLAMPEIAPAFDSASVARGDRIATQTKTTDLEELMRPEIERIQLVTMSERQEVEMGQQINEQIVQYNGIEFYQDSLINQYIKRIGRQLAHNSDRPDLPYTFQIVNDDNINAFATMGGFVYINTGLLQIADNEAQVAGVLAHEIGHITGKHALQKADRLIVERGLTEANRLDPNIAVRISAEVALKLSRSRGQEREADRTGLETLMRTGYAPAGAVQMLQKLSEQTGDMPVFFRTHPAPADRIVDLEQAIEPSQRNTGKGLDSAAYKARIQRLLDSGQDEN